MTEQRYELVITGEAEVVSVAQKLAALRALCESRQEDGADVESIWPSEVIDILEGRLL